MRSVIQTNSIARIVFSEFRYVGRIHCLCLHRTLNPNALDNDPNERILSKNICIQRKTSGSMPLVYEKMMISVFPRFAEEEQRNRSAAGMTADGRSDGVYLDPAVQVLKPFLYKICNRACILIAA